MAKPKEHTGKGFRVLYIALSVLYVVAIFFSECSNRSEIANCIGSNFSTIFLPILVAISYVYLGSPHIRKNDRKNDKDEDEKTLRANLFIAVFCLFALILVVAMGYCAYKMHILEWEPFLERIKDDSDGSKIWQRIAMPIAHLLQILLVFLFYLRFTCVLSHKIEWTWILQIGFSIILLCYVQKVMTATNLINANSGLSEWIKTYIKCYKEDIPFSLQFEFDFQIEGKEFLTLLMAALTALILAVEKSVERIKRWCYERNFKEDKVNRRRCPHCNGRNSYRAYHLPSEELRVKHISCPKPRDVKVGEIESNIGETISKTFTKASIPFDDFFNADQFNRENTVFAKKLLVVDSSGEILPSCFYLCTDCGLSMYDKKVTRVKIIGDKGSTKSCFCASLMARNFDDNDSGEPFFHIENHPEAPEYKCYENMAKGLESEDPYAPDKTLPDPAALSGLPILVGKYNGQYLGFVDVPGEHLAIAVNYIVKKDVVMIMVDLSDNNSISNINKALSSVREGFIKRIVICITKLDYIISTCCPLGSALDEAMQKEDVGTRSRKIKKLMIGPGCEASKHNDIPQAAFQKLYSTCELKAKKSDRILFVAHAALGCGTNGDGGRNYLSGGVFSPKYMRETLEAITAPLS